MRSQPVAPVPRRWFAAFHLIWALPVALMASYFMLFISTLNWCGASGCSGAGFGRISDPNVTAAVVFLIAAGVVAALPLALVPWSPRKMTRWLVGLP